jgi:hypothetical protein
MRGALAERAASWISRTEDRRSFLTKTAIIGTALSVAPLEYALEPKSAYATVCRCGAGCACGSACCDGYTEFCCTSSGQNRCPDGTVHGGWWKVDGSQFCGGGPRYYLDCNAQCGTCGCGGGLCSGACSGTGCGCAQGNCGNRKTGCTLFRYGQCNQQMACLGPIVCRVVTCTAPWALDPTCGTSSRTDNATRNHDRPCLDSVFGAVDAIADTGGTIEVSGWAVDPADQSATDVRVYLDGRLAAGQLANMIRPDVGAAYPTFGSGHGYRLDLPVAPGDHFVCVYAVSDVTGYGTFLGLSHITVAGPFGSLDVATATGSGTVTVSGWAVDPANWAGAATVEVSLDGTPIQRFTAGSPRPDVGSQYPTAGPNHGFTQAVATGAGQHTICLTVLGSRGGSQRIGCEALVVV